METRVTTSTTEQSTNSPHAQSRYIQLQRIPADPCTPFNQVLRQKRLLLKLFTSHNFTGFVRINFMFETLKKSFCIFRFFHRQRKKTESRAKHGEMMKLGRAWAQKRILFCAHCLLASWSLPCPRSHRLSLAKQLSLNLAMTVSELSFKVESLLRLCSTRLRELRYLFTKTVTRKAEPTAPGSFR